MNTIYVKIGLKKGRIFNRFKDKPHFQKEHNCLFIGKDAMIVDDFGEETLCQLLSHDEERPFRSIELASKEEIKLFKTYKKLSQL